MRKDVLTTGQAARLCGVSIRTLKRWLERGELGGYRLPVSGEWRIRREELASFMERHGIPLGALADGRRRRVLVVEAGSRIQAALAAQDSLLLQGSATGYEACFKASALEPEAIIIDLSTVDLNALELASAMRDHPGTRRAKLLFVGADPASQGHARLKDFGALLPQGHDQPLLLEALLRLLGQH